MPTLISENGQSTTVISEKELEQLFKQERVFKIEGLKNFYKLVSKEQKKIIEDKRKEKRKEKLWDQYLKQVTKKKMANPSSLPLVQQKNHFEFMDENVFKNINHTNIYDVWCDGSIHPYTKKASISGIIKTPKGEVLYHYAKEVPYHPTILYIEYLALHTMLTNISKLHLKNVNIHMDNLNLIDWIEGKPSKYGRLSRTRKDIRQIHESTLEKLNKLRYFIMTWVPREKNQEADLLAKKIYIQA